ncbi:hypothetical protein SASPL_128066 [Salvia splendens]|uniref:Uncharacterized protein n=1 Tax=Salvia splendens TaxID=180675 RepID=A0A8X8XCC8_SALSN|nr:hypothetical protein SASPL_128066 [Salvia splendens]
MGWGAALELRLAAAAFVRSLAHPDRFQGGSMLLLTAILPLDDRSGIASEKKTPSIPRRVAEIISCIWAHQADQPSSHMSVVPALHAELERARTQVNYLMQEQRNRDGVHHLIKCFAKEKMSWKRSSSSHQPSSHMLDRHGKQTSPWNADEFDTNRRQSGERMDDEIGKKNGGMKRWIEERDCHERE